MCKSLRAHCPWTGSTSYPAPRHFQAPRLSSAADYWLEDEICDESGNLPWDFSEMEGWTKNVREKLCAMQHFKECEIDSISMGCNSTSQDQKYLLVFMFLSNARALFLKRLAGPPSYLEYAVGYPSLWSAVLSPLPASHQGACCQTNRPAHCHSLRIPNKVTQLATMHLATWLVVSYRHRKGLC